MRVVRRSGHRTYRLIVADEHVEEGATRTRSLDAAGGLVERFNDVFWSVDVPPDAVAACVPLIEAGEADGIWQPEDATDADLGRWAVPEAAVFAEARQNLQARAWQGIEPLARGAYTLLQIASKDDYESSRAALPGWLASFAPHVQGVPICAFPERSALFVTGDGNPAAIAHLLALAHHGFTTSSRAISPLAYYAIADGRLVPLQLPPGHPVAGALAQAQRLFAERLPA